MAKKKVARLITDPDEIKEIEEGTKKFYKKVYRIEKRKPDEFEKKAITIYKDLKKGKKIKIYSDKDILKEEK